MRLILLGFCIVLAWVLPPAARAGGVSQAVADQVLAGTVVLRSDDIYNRFLGSGFVFETETRVISNAHVVGKSGSVKVVLQDGTVHRAVVERRDDLRDIVVLKTREKLMSTPLRTARQKVHAGQPVFAIGAPLEAAFSITSGIVSATARQIEATEPVHYIQHSAAVNPGSSGGPLVDAQGRVVGINARISDGSRFFVGIAYAVPVSALNQLMAGDMPGKPHLAPGFRLRPLTPRIRAALGINISGVLVDQVHANGPADQAGIKSGDILTHIGGHRIAGPGDVAFALAATQNAQVPVTVSRNSIPHTVTMIRTPPSTMLATTGQSAPQKIPDYNLADIGLQVDGTGEITAVNATTPGFFSPLSVGDRIVAINGTAIDAADPQWPQSFRFDAAILLRIVLPDGTSLHTLIDPWDTGAGLRLVSGANVLDREVISFD